MLQQTRVTAVIPYYTSFVARFPDIRSLARADEHDVIKQWEGLGYYRRARNLQSAAQHVVAHWGGKIPDDPAQFRGLPGVGAYIEAAVQSIAFQHPLAVVDGNVRRVLSRLFAISTPGHSAAGRREIAGLADSLLDRRQPGEFNQAAMEFGALVCTPRAPRCAMCPLARRCAAFTSGTVAQFPVRAARRAVPEYRVAVGVIERRGRLLITRRREGALLGGLWEFPGGKIRAEETPQEACVREIREETGLNVRVDHFVTRVRHAYSHFRVEIDVFRCSCTGGRIRLSGPVDYRWILLEETSQYAFPTANRKFIPLLDGPPDDFGCAVPPYPFNVKPLNR